MAADALLFLPQARLRLPLARRTTSRHSTTLQRAEASRTSRTEFAICASAISFSYAQRIACPTPPPTEATSVQPPSIIRRVGGLHKRAAGEAVQPEGNVAGTDRLFLLRTTRVSSVPTESSYTASAAMLGQSGLTIVAARSVSSNPPTCSIFRKSSAEESLVHSDFTLPSAISRAYRRSRPQTKIT